MRPNPITMLQNLLIIRDNAHGADVPGKRSPDGTHLEWKWSRERWNQIEIMLKALGFTVVDTNPTDKEIGLWNRVAIANKFVEMYPNKTPLLLSLHNDASGITSEWREPRGVSVWTCRKENSSDSYAAEMIAEFDMLTKGRTRMRRYHWQHGKEDFEKDFTVLLGNYHAILIECCFQDNKKDVALLKDPIFNKMVEDTIVTGIERIAKIIDPKYKPSYEK